MGLVSSTYFDNIVHGMVRAGFALISRVAISDQDTKYHVPATMARDTRLVFHVLGKQIIILLAYHEDDYYETGKVRGYWTINLYFGQLPYTNPDLRLWEQLDMLESRGEPEIKLEGFSNRIWRSIDGNLLEQMYEELRPFDAPVSTETVIAAATTLRNALASEAAPGRFDRLQVTTFPPYYTFPKCESLFWSRFDTAYFRSVVRDPWGSAGH